ncbi:Bifunctional inhibitor/lipid-transfer protein/seed storage 2S albumin superfamily protein [Theobroma cacao]|uniref:Bifunctional inhibitor/lipid-transfer protein/seed storage 2S albumin superfamily protein n=1 Tax=Theobroma cacao TaxID=3641 RepID=A0A061G158_THECC|nr:Bifunctional inhibitor/lipid-transfer protein/seed storage 2S albumin superfamily protein [Theobroma cacao]
MGGHGIMIGVLMLLSWAISTAAAVDCTTVTGLLSTCSAFITYGSPDPYPGSPCCDAVMNLNLIADSTDNRKSVCGCLMGLITTYNPNSTAIATLPGFCGVALGFTIDPNTDCNLYILQSLPKNHRHGMQGGSNEETYGGSNKKLPSATDRRTKILHKQ